MAKLRTMLRRLFGLDDFEFRRKQFMGTEERIAMLRSREAQRDRELIDKAGS